MQDRKWVRKLLKWKSSQVESSTYIVKNNMSDSPHSVRIRMGQMERIKPCVRVIQRRVKQFLLRFQFEEIKHKTLLKTCVTFTHKKMVHQ